MDQRNNISADKHYIMNKEIKSKIIAKMKSGHHNIQLMYLDIRLDMHIYNNDDGHIKISAFSRGHYVRENPDHRIMHKLADKNDPASCKGDGEMFLALTVIHCNEVFGRPIPYWLGGSTEWWRLRGVCIIKKACIKTERSYPVFEINNNDFLDWSNNIIAKHIGVNFVSEEETLSPERQYYNTCVLSGGRKLRTRKPRKTRRKILEKRRKNLEKRRRYRKTRKN